VPNDETALRKKKKSKDKKKKKKDTSTQVFAVERKGQEPKSSPRHMDARKAQSGSLFN
jgi:hypothetical protein